MDILRILVNFGYLAYVSTDVHCLNRKPNISALVNKFNKDLHVRCMPPFTFSTWPVM